MFNVGDIVAHPMHGAGRIDSIVKKRIDGVENEYYVLKMPTGEMSIMVPVLNSAVIGLREIVSAEYAIGLLEAFPGLDVCMQQNWNKRYRENVEKIKSGDPMEVAAVVKGLMSRDAQRGLSTGERRMLHSAKQILISELVVALGRSFEEIEQTLLACIGKTETSCQ